MNHPPLPLGAIVLAACALAVALVVGALWLAWASLCAIASVIWQAWIGRRR